MRRKILLFYCILKISFIFSHPKENPFAVSEVGAESTEQLVTPEIQGPPDDVDGVSVDLYLPGLFFFGVVIIFGSRLRVKGIGIYRV